MNDRERKEFVEVLKFDFGCREAAKYFEQNAEMFAKELRYFVANGCHTSNFWHAEEVFDVYLKFEAEKVTARRGHRERMEEAEALGAATYRGQARAAAEAAKQAPSPPSGAKEKARILAEKVAEAEALGEAAERGRLKVQRTEGLAFEIERAEALAAATERGRLRAQQEAGVGLIDPADRAEAEERGRIRARKEDEARSNA